MTNIFDFDCWLDAQLWPARIKAKAQQGHEFRPDFTRAQWIEWAKLQGLVVLVAPCPGGDA